MGIKGTKGSWGEERKGQRDFVLLCGNVIILITAFKEPSARINH